MFGNFSEIKIPGREKYTFYGVAFVREHNELSIMAVVGKDSPSPSELKMKVSEGIMAPGKEFLSMGREGMDLGDEALFGNPHIQPIIALTRIDLVDMTVQVRYVLEEKRDSFIVWTDDPQITEEIRKSSEAERLIESSVENISKYSDLINFVNAMPQFYFALDQLSDQFVIERRPTKLRLESNSTPVRKVKARLKNFNLENYVLVSTLAESMSGDSNFIVRANDLKVEVDGYWKNLGLGSSGADKFGRLVQGKSWVTKHKSWVERSKFSSAPVGTAVDVTISVDKDEAIGYIYVLRSSMHPKNVYKIGFTVKTPDERAAQLSATCGQPDMFNVIQSWRVKNPRAIEAHVHDSLREHRINMGREFFMLSIAV